MDCTAPAPASPKRAVSHIRAEYVLDSRVPRGYSKKQGFCRWLLFVVVGCCWLLLLVVVVAGCCWLLLVVVGCCRCSLLLVAVGCCSLLLVFVRYSWLLLLAFVGCCWLL